MINELYFEDEDSDSTCISLGTSLSAPIKSSGVVEFKLDKAYFETAALNFIYREQLRSIKENYCELWINNLLKKNSYLELVIQLIHDEITDDEFEEEISTNPEKYTIELNKTIVKEHIPVLINLLNKTGREFSLDEVSEMFSIELNSLKDSVEKFDKIQYRLF